MYFVDALSLLILVTCFMLIANKRIKSCIKTFRLQSLLIALTAGVIGFQNINSREAIDIIIVSVLIFVLKVIYIPHLLNKTFAKVEYVVEKGFYLNIPLLILISSGLVVFSYFSLSVLGTVNYSSKYIINSISVVFIGLLFMISRKKAIGQIVGFLVIENGIFITAMLATHGVPIVVDLGIFVDLITAILIMGVLVFDINEKFETTDVNRLKRLRG